MMKTISELRSECGSDERFGQVILEKVKILIEENPDYVYRPKVVGENDVYSYVCGADESKGCIIGQALQLLDVRLEDNEYANKTFSNICSSAEIDRQGSIYKLIRIQSSQDAGNPWGKVKELI